MDLTAVVDHVAAWLGSVIGCSLASVHRGMVPAKEPNAARTPAFVRGDVNPSGARLAGIRSIGVEEDEVGL